VATPARWKRKGFAAPSNHLQPRILFRSNQQLCPGGITAFVLHASPIADLVDRFHDQIRPEKNVRVQLVPTHSDSARPSTSPLSAVIQAMPHASSGGTLLLFHTLAREEARDQLECGIVLKYLPQCRIPIKEL